jgi:Pyruvate/2-oxoacid:ferredoxin oxidoreductase gamma subunit
VVVYDADVVKIKSQKSNLKNTRLPSPKGEAYGGQANQKSKMLDNDRIPPLTGTCTVNKAKQETKLRQDIKFISINLTKIAEEVGGNKIMKNVAAVGASLALFEQTWSACLTRSWSGKSLDNDLVRQANQVIADIFRKKGNKIIKANQRVLEAGYREISKLI